MHGLPARVEVSFGRQVRGVKAMGEIHEFSTGAVRGTAHVPRYDLVPLVGLRRLADTSAEGAQKFGAGNWLNGIPSSNLVSHALNHIVLYLDGDRSEDHLGHAIWGLMAIAHNEERRPDMHDLQGQREVPGPSSPTPDPISAEIDGLPSVATAAPSGPHHPPDPTAVEPSFADAALSAVQEFFGPSGPREGLQEPPTPQSPMDAGYDDWMGLVNRVNASAFRPWVDNRAGWCARSPVTKRVRIFGWKEADGHAAYRWVHGLLDQSSMVATQPPSAPEEETSS
jgi:hypothetical protein